MTDTTHVLKLIRAVEQADSSERLLDAVQQLASARLLTAVPTLIAALGYNNPGAAVAAVDGLVQIGEAAVQPLLEQIDDKNYGARAWAIRALAGIGDSRALDTLLYAAKTDFALSVRRAAAKGLGTLRWHQLPLAQVQPAQAQALEALLLVSQDSEWVVRYAAVVGLQALATSLAATQPDWVLKILAQLDQVVETDADKAVRTRVQMAQQQLQELSGWTIVRVFLAFDHHSRPHQTHPRLFFLLIQQTLQSFLNRLIKIRSQNSELRIQKGIS